MAALLWPFHRWNFVASNICTKFLVQFISNNLPVVYEQTCSTLIFLTRKQMYKGAKEHLIMVIIVQGSSLVYRFYLFLIILCLRSICVFTVLANPSESAKKLNLRRSKRTRLQPLRKYAGERPIYKFDAETGEFDWLSTNGKSSPKTLSCLTNEIWGMPKSNSQQYSFRRSHNWRKSSLNQ